MATLQRRVHDCNTTSPYLRHARNNTSQGGEDGVIAEIFHKIFAHVGHMDKKPYCVDIGAWDGKHISNSFELVHEKGWSGLLVEADADRFSDLQRLYSSRVDVACVNQLVDISGENGLLRTLQRNRVPTEFDFLSIDVDGADYHLWNSLRDAFRPSVVCIEFNPSIQNNVVFIQEADIRIQQGSSLLALKDLGASMGYTIVVTTLFNAFFVRNDLAPVLLPFSTSLDDLHSSSMITDMFQTYDGELKFVGPRKLLWHKVSMNPEKMQPLTKKQRRFLFRPGAVPGLHPTSKDKCERPSETRELEAALLRVNEIATTLSSGSDSDVDELRRIFFDILKISWNLLPLSHCQGLVIEVLYILLGILTALGRWCVHVSGLHALRNDILFRIVLLFECRGYCCLDEHRGNSGKEVAVKWLKLAYFCLCDGTTDLTLHGSSDSITNSVCSLDDLCSIFDSLKQSYTAWRDGGGYTALSLDFAEESTLFLTNDDVLRLRSRLACKIGALSLQSVYENDSLADSPFETLYWASRAERAMYRSKILKKICSSYGVTLSPKMLLQEVNADATEPIKASGEFLEGRKFRCLNFAVGIGVGILICSALSYRKLLNN